MTLESGPTPEPTRRAPSDSPHPSEGVLKGRHAVVTGGTGALGRHVVAAFLREGAVVHVPFRSSEGERQLRDFLREDPTIAHPASLRTAVADMTDEGEVESFFRTASGDGSHPTVLATVLGGFSMAPIEDTSLSQWEAMWRLNATSAFLACRAAVPGMRGAGWGRIILVGAVPALSGGASGMSAYGASKAAVLNLMGTLSRELSGDGITVNAVIPTTLDTPANRNAMPDASREEWLPPEQVADAILGLAIPGGDLVTGTAVRLSRG